MSFITSKASPFLKSSFQSNCLFRTDRLKWETIHIWAPMLTLEVELRVKMNYMLLNIGHIGGTPLITNFSIVLQYLLGLAIWWKVLVFLSTSLSHNALNFCLQHTSFKRVVFSNSVVTTSLLNFSSPSPDRGLYSSVTSRPL
jgi:hypothetical protein